MKVIVPFESFMDEPSILNEPEITVRDGKGRKVRIICTDAEITDYPVVGIVEHEDPSRNHLRTYTKDGKYMSGGSPDELSENDLQVEVDNDAVTERTGVDPLKAAVFASAMFGDIKQYTPEELELISLLSLAVAAE